MKPILSSLVLFSFIPSIAVAQITPDSSLGAENSVVESNGNRDTVQGGAVRNANLFHSFQEFNVGAGREAYFVNPNGIANIFSRVTGNNFSNIQGVLGVLGNANLYLINPNGILFGENARLDVNGSFFATTADSVVFRNGFEFSAANPNQPPLLTIDIPIGLRFRDNPGDIINQSNANGVGLSVKEGESISLIGGNVSIENGGIVFAPGGRIELGGLVEAGTIEIAEDSTLSFSDGAVRGDVSIVNSSAVAVFSGGGGSIGVNARNFNLTNGSSLIGGILTNQGSIDATAGDISINATETVSLDGQGITTTGIFDVVLENSTGNAGSINITTKNLSLNNGAKISATNGGQGNAGSISISASETTFLDGQETGLLTNVRTAEAIGNGGDIDLTTGSLTIRNGASLNANNVGQGRGGNISINAADNVSLTNSSFVDVRALGGGSITVNARNFELLSSRLLGGIGAGLSSIDAQAGDITINATDNVSIDGQSSDSITKISNSVSSDSIGNAGKINVSARNISLTNGGKIDSFVVGQGNSSDITLNARENILIDGSNDSGMSFVGTFVDESGVGNSGTTNITAQNLTLTNGGQVKNTVAGVGNSGDININVGDSVSVDGVAIFSNLISSLIISNVGTDARGNSGNINITTSKLSLTNGGGISASTLGIGNAGNIDINATESITLNGRSSQGGNFSSIDSVVLQGAVGKGGNIKIATENFSIFNGARVDTSIAGRGNGGTIEINATESITLNGRSSQGGNFSSINSSVIQGAMGKGGNIKIATENFSIFNGARVDTGIAGRGNGGTIEINATNLSLIDGGIINASTFGIDANNVGQGNAGNITINVTDTLNINGTSNINSQGKVTAASPTGISASNLGNSIGNAGNIDITASKLFLTNGAFVTTSTIGKGNAGSIFINAANTVSLTKGAQIGSSTASQGDAGSIFINTTDTVALDGEGQDGISSAIDSSVLPGAVGNGGAVRISTSNLTLTNGALVSSSTASQGDAGSIFINTTDTVALDGEGQDGISSAIDSSVLPGAIGKGGEVRIDTHNLTLTNGAQILSDTFSNGKAGSIFINATDTVSLDGEDKDGVNTVISSSVDSGAIGEAGEVRIDTRNLTLTNGAQILSSTFGEGNAGSVTINAPDTVSLDGEDKDGNSSAIATSVEAGAVGNAGEIRIDTGNLTLTNGATITSDTLGEGNADSITINTINLSLTDGAQISSSTFSQGKAGSVIVHASDSVKLSGVSAVGRSGLFANAIQGSGNGGDIEVFTNELIVRDGATISASNFQSLGLAEPGTGEAGSVRIEASNLTLENGGRINAATQAGDDGNITLKVAEDIILRDDSLISARAFKDATGGNIDIDAEFIIAFPSQVDGNDIIASAEQGQGGNINITAEALLGIQERKATPGNETNDIDASSEFGLSGEVSIEQPTVDPTRGLVELTQEVVDASKLIAQNVCTQTANSEFVDIGKGGLPQNPDDILAEDMSDVGLVAPVTASGEEIESNRETETVKPKITRKPPAQGWIWHEDGSVELVAYNPNQAGEQRTWDNHRGCQ